MNIAPNSHPSLARRAVLAVGLGTALSLLGDTTLYTVLPTHTLEAGITLAGVGVILSANRWVRLLLNGPAGAIYDRGRRKPLFISALFLGALSTALYGLTRGFWPLLASRLLWGLAWAGIWVGGNTIILDVATRERRGRLVGAYQVAFFIGAAGGAILGGALTDRIGYHSTLLVHSGLTLLGAFLALVLLPETRSAAQPPPEPLARGGPAPHAPRARAHGIAASLLLAVNRLVVAGMLASTMGLLLRQALGDRVILDGATVGVATLTGLALGASTLISMFSAPLLGALSDRTPSRWHAVGAGLVPGVAGMALLSMATPASIALAIPLTAVASGGNQGLSTALVGDVEGIARRGRRLGWLFTVGDLASAIGPPLAYALLPLTGLRGVYLLGAALFSATLIMAVVLGARLGIRRGPTPPADRED